VFQQQEGTWRRTGEFNAGNCGRQIAAGVLAGGLRCCRPAGARLEVEGHRLPPSGYTPYCE
jgi:hypothetical protein